MVRQLLHASGGASRLLLLALVLGGGGGRDGCVGAAAAGQTAGELFAAANGHYDAERYTEARPLYLEAANTFNHSGSQSQLGRICCCSTSGMAGVPKN